MLMLADNLLYTVYLDHTFGTLLSLFLISLLLLFNNGHNPFLVLVLSEFLLILVCLLSVYLSLLWQSFLGIVLALFIIAFAGAEASVGISVLIAQYRLRGLFSIEYPSALEI